MEFCLIFIWSHIEKQLPLQCVFHGIRFKVKKKIEVAEMAALSCFITVPLSAIISHIPNQTIMKYILTLSGLICVTLASIGLFLPILPTTPFLLLAAWLFMKGNPKLRSWLISHPVFGKFINNYIEHKAIPLHAKYVIIATLWLTIGISSYIINPIWIKILLICIATAVTIHIATFKTLKK